jgi:hypothetical protein
LIGGLAQTEVASCLTLLEDTNDARISGPVRTRRSRPAQPREGLTRLAVSATLHCLTGCAIGEVLGLVLATWWGLG